MSLSAAYVTLGPLCRIEGVLPPHAIHMAKRAGAFQHGGETLCRRQDWERVEGALRAAGVVVRVDGSGPPGRASLGLGSNGTGRIEGVLPRKVPKTWLARIQGRSLANITPYALREAWEALAEDKVQVEVSPEYRRAAVDMDDRSADVLNALCMPEDELPDVQLLKGALRPYQRRVLAFGDACRGRFYLADEAGIGKTLSTIGYALHRKCDRVLVVCPGSVKGQWRDEIADFAGGEVFVAHGRSQERIPASTKWLITNPDILADRYDDFAMFRAQYLIRDEAHSNKSPDGNRVKALRALALQSPFYTPMTGTPVENTPIDAWVQLDMVQPNWWGPRYDFGLAFCEPEQNWWASKKAGRAIYDFKGVTEASRPVLRERLAQVMLRRTLVEVGLQMPKQTRTRIRVELDSEARQAYQKVVAEYRKLVDGATKEELEKLRPKRAALVMRMRRASSMGRIGDTVELVESHVDAGDRPIVFGYYQETLDALAQALRKRRLRVGLVHGSIVGAPREAAIKAFKDGKSDVLVSSIAVGGVGLNFQHTSRITIAHELSYKPIDIPQSEARVFRSGQTRAVQHVYALGEGTVDERVLNILFRKMAASKAFVEGGKDDTEDDILRDIEGSFFTDGT